MTVPRSIPAPISLRALVPSVYAPTLLFAIGQGAVIPIVALAARDLGGSVAVAGFVVGLRGIGILAFDVPAGWLVGRFGERTAMAAATGLVVVALAGSALAPTLWLFAVFTFLMGCGWSIWLLARLSYMSEAVPLAQRGRALSTLGGVNRIGNFIGPLIGAGVAVLVGLDGAYYVHLVTAVAACALLLATITRSEGREGVRGGHANVLAVVREHSGVFLTAGLGSTSIQVLRATRQSVLPLWADHIGLDAGAVSLIFGISVGIEVLMFYPAGSASDRWGRKAVAIPCLAVMSLGMIVLPLTGAFWSMALVGTVIGIGNGLGSGINMTVGADFAPAIGRARFLGAWRLFGDLGTAGGPMIAAGIAGVVSLGVASVAMGAIGAAGASLIYLRMPEPLRRGPPPRAERGPPGA